MTGCWLDLDQHGCNQKAMIEHLTLSRKEAKKLLIEIASVAEAAYRRGAQQAVALKVSDGDLSWYRYYQPNSGRNHIYLYANPLPESGRNGKKWRTACINRMEWRSWVYDDGPFENLVRFTESPAVPA